jgi:hypothetical protein
MQERIEEVGLSEISAAYKQVAATREGQIVIQDLVRKYGFSRSTTLNTDPLRMAWNEGGRSVCVHIGRMIDYDADQLAVQTAARGEG